MTLTTLRASGLALAVACAAWATGCATRPMIDPAFANRSYTPTRIALMPPDVFVVLDQVGENDAVKSAALGQAVSIETVRAVEQSLRSRGYDVDLSARWDGIIAQDGSVLVNRDELGWLANGILQFANGPAGGGQGPMTAPGYVAPELAAKVGWATQSDAILYVNVKGVTTTPGKRAASILTAVFIVVIIAAIIIALAASSKNGGNSSGGGNSAGAGGFRGQPVGRAPAPSTGGGFRGTPAPSGGGGPSMPSGGGWRGSPPGASAPAAAAAGGGGWRGGPPTAASPSSGVGGGGWRGTPGGGSAAAPGAAPRPVQTSGWRGPPAGAPVYVGGPRVSFGVGVFIPLDGPVYTHDGTVTHDDDVFAGDELYVSMTLISAIDGRILWHARDHLDLDADDNRDVNRMVQTFLGSLPARGGFPQPHP